MEAKSNRTLAIASGKGGVGKTVVTANLAICLAQQLCQKQGSVVAIDLDLGCGNLNACLGVRSNNGNINNFLLNQETSLKGILTPTGQESLQVICSSYSGAHGIQLSHDQKRELLAEVGTLDADFVLMDLGAGISTDVLDLFLGASEKIVVITPESLSLHNAFVFLKTVILHLLWREVVQRPSLASVKENWRQAIDDPEHLDIPTLIGRIKLWDMDAADTLKGLINDLQIKFVVNKYRGGVENLHLKKFHDLLFKYLSVRTNISYLGFVHFDFGISESTQAIKPFLLSYPNNRAAKDLRKMADRLAGETVASLGIPMTPQGEQPVAENLGEQVPPTAQASLAWKELPRTLVQEKGYGRRVAFASGCLVIIVTTFWWYLSGELPGGLREQSTSGQTNEQREGAEGSFPIVPEITPPDMEFEKSVERVSEAQDIPAQVTEISQEATVPFELSSDSQVTPGQLVTDQPARAEPKGLPDEPLLARYTIQVGVFSTHESAKKILSQLSAKGYPGMIEQTEIDEDRYYVWSGQFTSPAQASGIQTRLKADGFETYIKKVVSH